MTMRTACFVRLACVLALASSLPSDAIADGGRLQIHQRFEEEEIAVFTSPHPARAGIVDVSVLVHETLRAAVPEAEIQVRCRPRGGGHPEIVAAATRRAATNKLFQAATIELPASGHWHITVAWRRGDRPPREVGFVLEVAEPLPAALGVWPWFSWPALAVALFAAHRWRAARRRAAADRCRTARDPCEGRANRSRRPATPACGPAAG